MEKKILIWLEDIHQAIDEIEEFLPEKRDFFTFKKDLKTRKAVERNIEIIGEAVKTCFPHWDTLKIFFNNFK